MKRKTLLLTIMTLLLTFTFSWSAMAGNAGKTLFMENLKIQQSQQIQPDFNKPFDGQINLNINSDFFKTFDFENIKANIKYDMDFTNNQAFFKIDADVNGNKPEKFNLEIYIIDETMIIPADSLASIAKLDPGMKMPDENIKYVYTKLEGFSFAELQEQIKNQVNQQEAAMALVETIFAAIPDNCFSTSGQTAEMKLDKQAIVSIANNFKDEQFVKKLVEQMVALNPEAIKTDELVKELTSSEEVSFTEMFKDLTIRECKSTISPDKSSSDWDLSYSDEKINLDYKINSKASFQKEKMSSDVQMAIGFKSLADDQNFVLKIDTDSITNQQSSAAKGNLDFTGNLAGQNIQAAADFVIDLRFKDKVNFVAPVLTPENSIDAEILEPEKKKEPVGIVTVTVTVNDDHFIWFDNNPFIEENRIMVPVRELAEDLGCTVDWNPPAQVIIGNADKKIAFKIGEKQYVVNGQNKEMNKAPIIKDGITYVSIRSIAEEFGYQVSYNQEYNEVKLTNQ